jgi:hypothetical protein
MWPTPSYHDTVAAGQAASVRSAIEGRTIMSSRPWDTSTGTDVRARTSLPSISSRASSAPRMAGGTTIFQAMAAVSSSSPSGLEVHARRNRRVAAMFANRSGTHMSCAFSSSPGPMCSNAGGLRIVAEPARLMPLMCASP